MLGTKKGSPIPPTPHDAGLRDATTLLDDLAAKKAGHEERLRQSRAVYAETATPGHGQSNRLRRAASLVTGGGLAVAEVDSEQALADIREETELIAVTDEAIRMQREIVGRLRAQRGAAIAEHFRPQHIALVKSMAMHATELARLADAERLLCRQMDAEGAFLEPLRLEQPGSVRAVSQSRLWNFVERAVARGYLTEADRRGLVDREAAPFVPGDAA